MEFVVEFNIDMPIMGSSSEEEQIDASLAEDLQGDKPSVNGWNSLKRRSQQELEEARAEMRVKVESGIGLSCIFFSENGVDPTIPLRGVEGCQDSSVGDELTTEEGGLRPSVRGGELSTAVGNGTDLTDLLRNLDDSGDSEDFDDEFVGDYAAWPSLEADLGDELTGNSTMSETEVRAQTPLVGLIVKAVDTSSELEKKDSIGTEVQAHGHETMRMEKPPAEVIMLDSDSDDVNDFMFDRLAEAPQLKNTVKSEPGVLRQMPNQCSQLENFVMQEPGGLRQVPNGCPQVENSVKVEHGNTRQVPRSMESPGIHTGTKQNILLSGQQQPGTMVQVRIINGKLEPYFARIPVIPECAVRMSMFPFGGNLMHPGIHQAYNLPYLYPSESSTSFAPNNGHALEARSFGERAGRTHGLNPPSTLSAVPFSGEQSDGDLKTSTISAGVRSSGDQPRRSRGSNPSTNTSAAVPFNSGAGKSKPDLYGNTNLGPQNIPSHNQLAVVKRCYDSTVTSPRLDVARAMQQYDYYVTKAKNDRVREAFARTEATPNEFVKAGNRRGLDCRPDIVAYNEMKRECGDVNQDMIVGDLPGVEIGDKFTYRYQMAVVGLHRLPNVGIDYGHRPPDMIPTATAIVLMPKAGYIDDKDYGNTILYTGQGGRKKRNQAAPFVCNQELKKGNLALAKNFERKLPVRVIRGHSIMGNSGPGLLGYTYDGLYMITNYERSVGFNGFDVYKYSLERLEGQPPIPPCITGCTAHEWNKARGALGALPLQVVDPPVEEDVKHLCK